MIHPWVFLYRHICGKVFLQTVCLFVLSLIALPLAAQTESPAVTLDHTEITDPSDSLRTAATETMDDSAFQPEFNMYVPSFQPTAYGIYGYGPYYHSALGTNWQLHEGFNAQFSMDVTCGFGKNRIKGVGFGQTAAFAYVQPVTSRFSIAAGLYATNFDWGPWHMTDVGISGVLAYQLTDRLSVYAFGSKSFIPKQNSFNANGLAVPAYWMRPKNRFGAAAEYKFSDHFKMGISVERVDY